MLGREGWLAELGSLRGVDQHCHSVRSRPLADLNAFRACFSESESPEMAARHVQHQLYYRWALRELAGFFGCDSSEDAVFAARCAQPVHELTTRLLADARLSELYVDTGLGTPDAYSLRELEEVTTLPCFEVLRLESLAERLLPQHAHFAAFLEAFENQLELAAGRGVVALKSIAAYRCGLDFGRPTAQEAADGYARERSAHEQSGRVRLTEGGLIGHLVWRSLEHARSSGLPLQFHTGFGDADEDLLRSNCLLLRPLLEDEVGREVSVVILHSYPYEREAAHLAHLYPNVHLDLSGAIPWVQGQAAAMIEAVLGQCPASKLLFATDAARIPEVYLLGARAWRQGLAELLAHKEDEGLLDRDGGMEMATMIMSGNAHALYPPRPARSLRS